MIFHYISIRFHDSALFYNVLGGFRIKCHGVRVIGFGARARSACFSTVSERSRGGSMGCFLFASLLSRSVKGKRFPCYIEYIAPCGMHCAIWRVYVWLADLIVKVFIFTLVSCSFLLIYERCVTFPLFISHFHFAFSISAFHYSAYPHVNS